MSSTIDPSRFPDSYLSKRRKVEKQSDRILSLASSSTDKNVVPWRSESQRRIYSAKLVEALFRARNRSIGAAVEGEHDASSGGDVRGIADRVLASAAKGRTRWSRALLASRRVRMTALGKRQHRRVRPTAAAVGGGRWSRKGRWGRMLPAVERKVKVLSRLVPGCRGVSVTSLLEEATDYISALEMQVKAMAALSQLLGAPALGRSALAPAPSNDVGDDVSVTSARC